MKDDNVNFEAQDASMVELCTMVGILQQVVGVEAVKRGKSLDDVKDNMLDIHLAAMQGLTEQVISERGEAEG